MRGNVLQIGAGRDFYFETLHKERNFQYTIVLSYKALQPCLSLFAVTSWPSFFYYFFYLFCLYSVFILALLALLWRHSN